MKNKLVTLVSLFALSIPAFAQQSLGSLAGKVTDPQSAAVPGAAVVLTHTETNRVTRLSTNDTGYFEGTLLNPGTYTVAVEARGFKKYQQQGVVVQVASRVDLDIQLQIGQAAETVQVTAEAPLLETNSASGGRIIDQRQIMQLPFSDMNPFALATLAPGMQWTGQPEYRRAFDNGGTSSFNTAGGVGSNEYSIDGAPVTGTGRRVGFVPPSDAVEEFKLETANFDASAGFTSGATINVMTKPGTNKYHGSLYDQHWQQRWNATPHFTRLAFEDQVRRGRLSPDSQRQATGRSNNFGGTAGGPVRIPKLYNGTDKLFFFFSYNGIYQSKAETTDAINRTVPKTAWRQGDFSDLLAIDATRYTVYDPRSARLDNGRVVRTPFPGNRGVPVLNPVYKFYEPFYPKPNDVPGLASAEGTNNYYALAMPKDERFNSIVNRVDYNIAEKHRIFGRWYWNHRLANEYDWTYETKRGLHANGLTRINKGGGGEYIWTASSTSFLNVGASWTRFNEGSVRTVQNLYKPSDVGLPKYIDERADRFATLPRMAIGGVESVSDGYPAIGTRGTTGDLKVQYSNIRGNHSLRYGWQERRYWRGAEGPGNSSGSFSFDNNFMRQADNTNTASSLGLGWAAFMMGLPSGIGIDTNDTAYWSTRYRSLYVQDDLRVSNRFRLNLGLRYERGGGATERFNRGLAGGFDFNYRPPFAEAAEAAYARNPIAEVPASQFKVLGGSAYLGQPDKTFTNGHHTLLPKLGAVYQINNKTVIRGGISWYQDILQVNNFTPSQTGYSQPTSTILTNDRGLTFCCGLGDVNGLSASRNPMTDPFPVRAATNTRFDSPYGNTLGQNVQQGRGYSFLPRTFRPADQKRWRIGVQREIARDIVVEASYNGARSSIEVTQPIGFLPQQYWATGNVRRQDVDDALQATVPNPFAIANLTGLRSSNPTLYNYLNTIGFFTSTTIRKQQLLRAFPNMNGLNGLRPNVDFKDSRGRNTYHDMQLLMEKRFARGFASSVMYTYAYGRESDFYYNEFDPAPSTRPQDALRPHRFVWTMIYEMPFGKGKRFVNSGPARHLLGGWQLSWVYQYQNGAPTNWGNRFYYGDLANIASLLNHEGVHSSDIHKWFDPARYTGSGAIPQGFQGFEGRSASQPGAFHTRVFPTRLTDLREDGIRNWDVKIKRTFRIGETLRTSFDVDLLNATNHTNFSGPQNDPTNTNFGRVTSQRGLSRVIQLNLRVDF